MEIVDILENAIESEMKDKERYLALAKEAKDPETRAVLEQLGRDEEGHARKLRDRLAAIKLMRDLSR